MTMDVYGKEPRAPEGEYFQASNLRWHPLADYVCEVAPEIAHKCQYWHTNDGDGLNACDSIRLADRLQAEVDAGRTESYARIYQSKQAAMPKEPCIICGGTGTRHPVPFSTQMAQRDAMLELWELQSMIGDKDEEQAARIAHLRSVDAGDPKGDGIKCNGCYGDGYCEAWECNYVPVTVELVQKFVAFLRASGGFEI